MTVKTFTPRCQIKLSKNIEYGADVSARKSSQTDIDITPFLGDSGEITVAKSLYSPMGSFVIQIPDKPMALINSPFPVGLHGGDTLYGLVEPMDYVEIRMARFPTLGGELPIVMRGFVREVMRSETMGQGGKPRRVVVISGNDFGLLFSNYQITRFEGLASGSPTMLTFYRLPEILGVGSSSPLPAGDFMTRLTKQLIEPYLVGIAASPIMEINVETTVSEFGISIDFIDPMDQSIWNLMLREADTHFNELFIEDRAEGVYLVYRPTPWRDLKGEWIKQGTQTVGTEFIETHIRDVISLTAARDDYDVSNIFFVNPTLGPYNSMADLLAAAHAGGESDVIVTDHRNCDPVLYGPRVNSISIRQVPLALATPNTQQKEPAVQQNEVNMLEFSRERRRVFKELNQDNVVFEHGSMAMRGDETVKPGRYIQLVRGQLRGDRLPEYYVYGVTHRFAPFRQFVTVAQFVRGTGFIERIRLEGNPSLMEGKGGVYLNDSEWINWISSFK